MKIVREVESYKVEKVTGIKLSEELECVSKSLLDKQNEKHIKELGKTDPVGAVKLQGWYKDLSKELEGLSNEDYYKRLANEAINQNEEVIAKNSELQNENREFVLALYKIATHAIEQKNEKSLLEAYHSLKRIAVAVLEESAVKRMDNND